MKLQPHTLWGIVILMNSGMYAGLLLYVLSQVLK